MIFSVFILEFPMESHFDFCLLFMRTDSPFTPSFLLHLLMHFRSDVGCKVEKNNRAFGLCRQFELGNL